MTTTPEEAVTNLVEWSRASLRWGKAAPNLTAIQRAESVLRQALSEDHPTSWCGRDCACLKYGIEIGREGRWEQDRA